MGRVSGIVLAAGAGTRFGGPKALARDADDVPWVVRAVEALRGGGCDDVAVVLGAAAESARALVPADAAIVIAHDWAEGLSRSLAAGLAARRGADAVVIVPVDTPGVPATAVARVISAAASPTTALARATYSAAPGHPVLVGGAHIAALTASLTGDDGAAPYLRRHGATRVECGDLWSGEDIDTPGG